MNAVALLHSLDHESGSPRGSKPGSPHPVIEVLLPDGVADLLGREILFDNGEVNRLTPTEADLLRFLALHRGKPVSRAELLKNVWRLDAGRVTTRTVDIHIGKLRRRLRDELRNPPLLMSVRGFGYMFDR